ncbi:MAG TPA: GldG family protein [Thermoanaerobaculia bacterium]|nr:GldG family protein [Thermoanaerobaculia bacterium]
METLRKQRLVKTGTLSAGILLILALLAIVNYFSAKYYKRFDWTGSHIYSLSPKSREVLAHLRRDVDVVMLVSDDQTSHPIYEPTRELLARYAAASPRLHLRLVDPEKNRALAEQLARRYNVTSAGVVFASGNDRRVVDSADLADFDFSGVQLGQGPEMTGYKGEQAFTSALLQLSEGRKPKILFTTGHGEHSLDDNGARGLSSSREILGRDNFEMEEWASLGKQAVPPNTDLVVIAGPTGSFLQPEINALTAYLRSGGRMLVLLDPTLQGSSLVETGLEGWLAAYGVKVGRDIVVDPANPMPFFGSETLFVKDYGEHPITKAMRSGSLPVLVSLARSAGKGEAPAGADVKATELLRTSSQGWGETDLAHLDQVTKGDKDVPGPVSLGVAVEIKGGAGARPARLVAYGDSDFATNQLVRANGTNAMLLANSLNWLVERETLLGIPPKKTEQVRLSLTAGELRTVYVLSLLVLPGLAAAAGIYVYFRRRR